MSNLQDMQDKTVEIVLNSQKYIAHQLFIDDWVQVEGEIANDKVTINDLLSGEVSIIGYRAIVKVAIRQDLPSQISISELFEAAGTILNLDISTEEVLPEKNSQAMLEVT